MFDQQFIISLLSGIFIAGTAGYLGSLMLSRRMVLMADPLGHLALPGIALALIYGLNISLTVFPCIILGIFFIWLFERNTKLTMESLAAVVFAAGVAIAFLFLPIEEAEAALVGDVSRIHLVEACISIIICLSVFWFLRKVYPKLILINISEDLALSEGISIKKYNFLYLLLIAIVVSLGVKMVGGLLTAALVAIPSATARNISKNMQQYAINSVLFGVLSTILGMLLFKITNFPAGPLIILVGIVFFLISVVVPKLR